MWQARARTFAHRSAGLGKPTRLRCRHAATSQLADSIKREDTKHRLPNGLQLEVIQVHRAEGVQPKADLLFLHGSFHGAWCWQEHFSPYFAARGHTCYAISWRGQGEGDRSGPDVDLGKLDMHAADLDSFVATLPSPPVVICHSFSGIVVEKYLLSMSDGSRGGYAPLAGVGFLCCVPPSGNKDIVGRFLKKDFMLSMRITWGMVTKAFARSPDVCREMFFSPDLPQETLMCYYQQLAACSPIRLIDLQDMNQQVPLPPPPAKLPPIFVLGTANDNLVDEAAVVELAQYYGVQPVVLPNMAHDCMLDVRWEQAAGAVATWLDALSKGKS